MGLYDSFSVALDADSFKRWGILAVGALLVVGVAWFAFQSFQAKPLQADLTGFIDLTTTSDGFPVQPNAELTITVSNPNPAPVQNVSIFVKPQDEKALIVFPSNIRIDTLDKSRTVFVSVRPNPAAGKVLSGTYEIDVTAIIGNQTYTQSIELEIKNPEKQQAA